MPMYEYKCSDCNVIFEARQKFSDAPLTECRECGGSVRKVISQTAFTLKGGGWYDQGYTAPAASCATPGKSEACAGCPKAVNE
jgi:putative FmdB family regulatory protein